MNDVLWAILGPTACGKTDTAVEIAEVLGAEIVNVDSRQLYVGMDIGTAKPAPMQRARVPHHMIDVITPDVRWDAMRYARETREVIHQILVRGHRPLVVGGSGFYFAALSGRLHEDLPPRDESLRASLAAEAETVGSHGLWERLHQHDPATADRLHPHDTVRIIRALEVLALTTTSLSALARRAPPPGWGTWRVVVLALPRDLLKTAIRQRIRHMIEEGWVDEVKRLLARYSPSSPGLNSLGYPEIIAHVRNGMDLDEATERVALRTWQYARRQFTWFRRVPQDRWVTAASREDAARLIRGMLERNGSEA